MTRSIDCGASCVCNVAKTRWPVSAAVERGGDGLEVAHLTDEDDVGVLAQHVLERRRERVRVLADLALVDERALVRVQELDRVLDGHDVHGALAVHDVDERSQRRRLARTGRARDEHEAAAAGTPRS